MKRTWNRSGTSALLAAVVVGAAACAEGAAEQDDGDARLSSGAGALLADGAEIEQASQASGTDILGGPPPEGSVSIDSLGFDRGSLDAPVQILEFSDFGCGYCRQFHAETLPQLKAEYIAEGQVLWKQVAFVMGNWANSVPASLGAECAHAQGLFEPMSDGIYARQADWKNVSAEEGNAAIRSIATETGVDMAEWDACMAEDRHMDRVRTHTALARQAGVRSTPTFIVLGYAPLQGALPIDLFRQVIDTVLVLQTADGAAGGRP